MTTQWDYLRNVEGRPCLHGQRGAGCVSCAVEAERLRAVALVDAHLANHYQGGQIRRLREAIVSGEAT
jgi:hypothetical protein